MKKTVLAALLAGCLIVLAGCGNKKEDYSKYCTLGEYKNLTVSVEPQQEVTDEEVDEHVQAFRKAYAEMIDVTDRPVETGDVVNIDFVGYMDGEAFSGGEGSGYDLEIGSGSFIPGFEDGLIGAETGETRDVTATFPEPYENNPDFSGKEAVFTVTVNSIKAYDLPEFNDELVSSNTDFTTTDEYVEYVRSNLELNYANQAESNFRTAVMLQISENSEFKSYPEDKLEEYTGYWQQYSEMLASYAGYSSLEAFLAAQSMTAEALDEWIQGMAEESCKQFLMYTLIGEKEGIEITDEEIQAAIEEDATAAGMDSEAYMTQYELEEEDYHFELLSDKVMEFLKENTTVTESAE